LNSTFLYCRWNLLILIGLIILSACQMEFGGRRKKKGLPEESAAPVAIQNVARGDISTYLRFNTAIGPRREVDVYARTIGRVAQLPVEEGDFVKESQLLALLEDAEQRLAIKRASAELDHQSVELKRAEELNQKQMISEEDLTRVQLAVKNAQITLEQAELAYSYTRITAPLSGTISARLIDLGDRVDQARALFRIVDRSVLQVNAWVSEAEMARMTIGMTAEVVSPVDSSAKTEARLVRLGAVVDPTYGKIKAAFEFKDSDMKFKPGQYIELRMVLETHRNTIIIPKRAIIYESGLPFVFITRDSLAFKCAIRTGLASGAVIELLDGLSEGDNIIIDGQVTLRDSAKVKIIN